MPTISCVLQIQAPTRKYMSDRLWIEKQSTFYGIIDEVMPKIAACIVSTARETKGIFNFRPRTSIEKWDTCTRMRIKTSRKTYNHLLWQKKLPVIRKVPTLDVAKRNKENRLFQHIHMDFGFMVWKRGDASAYKRIVAHNGDMCYVASQCSATDFACGKASGTKVVPIEWLYFLLIKYPPWNRKGRTVRIDNGKLYATDFINLFEKFGYFVDATGLDNSKANSNVERLHVHTKEGVKCLIFGVSCSFKNWNLAFYHYILLYNTTSHGQDGKILCSTVSGNNSVTTVKLKSLVVESRCSKMESNLHSVIILVVVDLQDTVVLQRRLCTYLITTKAKLWKRSMLL